MNEVEIVLDLKSGNTLSLRAELGDDVLDMMKKGITHITVKVHEKPRTVTTTLLSRLS